MAGRRGVCEMHRVIERAARAGLYGVIVYDVDGAVVELGVVLMSPKVSRHDSRKYRHGIHRLADMTPGHRSVIHPHRRH
jgi:hypothetical protein